MGAKIREYRRKIDSTKSMKKIFNAMELIATSRINKARARVQASQPYALAITRAVSAAATHVTDVEHPLTTELETYRRSAILMFTSDRGLAGSYSANVIKTALELQGLLVKEGKEVEHYLVGRKAQGYFDFRNISYTKLWTGDTDAPLFKTAKEIAQEILTAYLTDYEAGGVDEIYLVFTRFKSMVEQEPTVVRLLPLEVVDDEEEETNSTLPLYDFEPSAEEILDELLPRYLQARIFASMLQAAASELATRQRAMKTAGDNAEELVTKYTRLRNSARQAEVTQELTEIVAGADSLST